MAAKKKKGVGRPRNEHPTVVVYARIRESELEDLDAAAEFSHMSRSEFVRSLIRKYLAARRMKS